MSACCGQTGCDTVEAQPPAVATVELRVHGMDCADEVAILKRALDGLVAEEALGFDVLRGRMVVPQTVPLDQLQARVAATGMRAEPWSDEPAESGRRIDRRAVLTTLSGIAIAVGLALQVGLAGIGHEVPWPARIAYLVAIGAGLVLVVPKAAYAARTLRPDMNLLMTIAVLGALAIGEWLEGATVSFLFAVSLLLESWSVGRARRAVEALLRIAPSTVRVLRDGRELDVDAASVPVGTTFVVRPGERIGLDGAVLDGRTEVDQAPITGESVPVGKEPGDTVYAGTINGSGAVTVRSTAAAEDTTLARVTRMVGEASQRRSASEQWVDRFARVYTPAVLAVAAAVAVIPPVLGGDASEWVYRALVLLVIGCPCALVVSTPVSVVSGLASAARHGVLVKSGRFLEVPAALRAVAFDKTGTITTGRPEVVSVESVEGRDPAEVLALAAAVERWSEHPLARAIVERAGRDGIRVPEARQVTAAPGRGASGKVDGRAVWVASPRWLRERGLETSDLAARLAAVAGEGQAVVVVGRDDEVVGLLGLADTLRPDSVAALGALRAAGVEHLIMLTGDNRGAAKAVADRACIDEVRSELLPEDKIDVVTELSRRGPVAMVGDGVNDAPALAAADLGIAMGLGTDVAIETADIALIGNDLGKLAWLVRHSRRTLSVIRQNAALSLGIKAVFVVLTGLGMASLWGAIAADMGATLLVTFNALRLLRNPARW